MTAPEHPVVGADHVGASWSARYDRLRLNTGRQFSHFSRRPYPKGTPVFPTRDQVVEHLRQHSGVVTPEGIIDARDRHRLRAQGDGLPLRA